jgi:hypothetical protein
VEVQAPGIIQINEIVAQIQQMAGVIDAHACTVVHSWTRTPVEHAW